MDKQEHPLVHWPGHIKKTKPRRQVLAVLDASQAPLSAMEIAQRVDPPIWLSTVYRVLEAFQECGMVEKTALAETGMAVYRLRAHGHEHYAVCLRCHRTIALEGCPLEHAPLPLPEGDFRVMGHQIQIFGYCGQCNGGAAERQK